MTTDILLKSYKEEKSWPIKVTLMEVYHLMKLADDKNWTVTKTAAAFDVSIGLASENLKLAREFHTNKKLMKCKYRNQALKRISNNGKNY